MLYRELDGEGGSVRVHPPARDLLSEYRSQWSSVKIVAEFAERNYGAYTTFTGFKERNAATLGAASICDHEVLAPHEIRNSP